MRYSISLLLLFLLGLLLTACSGHPAAISTLPKTGHPAATSTPPKGSPLDAGAVFASYVGKWEVHDALLTIHADRTGLEQWNAGPCTQSMTETRLCGGNANISFSVNADGSIKGTIQSIWYSQPNGKPAPAGFQSDPGDVQAGDTFELQHHGAHLLYTTWFGARQGYYNSGNRYWCDMYTPPADRPLCGA